MGVRNLGWKQSSPGDEKAWTLVSIGSCLPMYSVHRGELQGGVQPVTAPKRTPSQAL